VTESTTQRTVSKPVVSRTEDTFSLDVPNLSTSLKQGEAKQVAIALTRGKNFNQEVVLRFQDLPKGVTIDPAQVTVKPGDKEAKLTVKAAADAPIGTFNIKVAGEPKTGATASNEFKIAIAAK